MEYEKYNELAEMLKALAHPIRICIVTNLLKESESNVSYMQTCLQIPQSTLSQHLQKLRSARIIEGRRNGLEVHYRVCNDKAEAIIKALKL